MPEVTIVAIPKHDDYVWKISSEKIPHLTILRLGSIDDSQALMRVTQFVKHIAESTLSRFYLTVEKRGVLGPQEADVLFFEKRWLKEVELARNAMLRQPEIKTAYHAVDQFPEWTPHLTLGYPTSPAKPDNRDYPGIYDVGFDKLAVWTDDYSGSEFELGDRKEEALAMTDTIARILAHATTFSTKPWSDFKESDYSIEQWRSACLIKPAQQSDSKADYKLPVKEPDGTYNKNAIYAAAGALSGARGGVQASSEQKAAAKKKLVGLYNQMGETPPDSISGETKHSDDVVTNILAHHGVKGMKWGVRRAEKRWNKQISTVNTKGRMTLAFHNETVSRINRAVDDLNGRDEYRNVDVNTFTGKTKQKYEKDAHEAIMRALEDSVRSHYGYSPSGTQRAVYNRKTDQIEVHQVKKVEHADTPKELVPDLTIQLKRDAIGRIVSVEIAPLSHSDIGETVVETVLSHYGVKGMKWGVRRDGSTSSTTVRTSRLSRPATDVTAKQKPGKFVRTSGGKRQVAAEEAVRTAAMRQIAKKSTTDALTNKQLQEAVTRMNLEQQYHSLVKKQDRRTRGQRFIQTLFGNANHNQQQNSATAQTAKQVAAALAKKAAAAAA